MAFIGGVLLLAVELRGGLYRQDITHKLVLLGVQVLEGSLETVWEATFACDPGYRSQWVSIVVEAVGHSDFPEAIGHDGLFYPDPSQSAVALVFYPRWGLVNKTQRSCVVRSETLLRLRREKGEGDIKWDEWGKYTIVQDMADDQSAEEGTSYSVSGSRFVRIDANFGAVKGAKVNIIDLSHWSHQQPDMRREGCGEPGGTNLLKGFWICRSRVC